MLIQNCHFYMTKTNNFEIRMERKKDNNPIYMTLKKNQKQKCILQNNEAS